MNLQAPLYDAYAAESDAGTTAVTVAFAAYVGGLMPTLLLLGGLSDRIGRRVPIALALILGTIATTLLVQAPSWISLVIARFMLGIGTGLATPSGTACMTEILGADRAKNAALIVTSATSLGFGGGALPAVQYSSRLLQRFADLDLHLLNLGVKRADKGLAGHGLSGVSWR